MLYELFASLIFEVKYLHTKRYEAVVYSSVRIETGRTAQSLLCFSVARYDAGANDVSRHNDF